jgi:hypothetical protein
MDVIRHDDIPPYQSFPRVSPHFREQFMNFRTREPRSPVLRADGVKHDRGLPVEEGDAMLRVLAIVHGSFPKEPAPERRSAGRARLPPSRFV